jgi:pre-mRNA-splicing factor 18
VVSGSPAPSDAAFNISVEETIRRLRAKGQPIRLFGESDKERRLRLRALELIEEKGHERHGGQNDFRKALEEVETREREMKAKEGQVKDKKKDVSAAGTEVLDLDLLKTDKNRLYPIIYHAIKRILNEWKEAMDERPESVKRTTQGKLAAATQQQSAEYLKPLFKLLRSRVCITLLILSSERHLGPNRIFLMMFWVESPRLFIIRKSGSTSALTMLTYGYPLAMHPGLSV